MLQSINSWFQAGCRPFIGLDGCHLRSKYLGCLLSVSALDGNYGLFLIAFIVVERESDETWYMFLQILIQAFQGELDNLTTISDQEKGLLEAITVLLPHVEHRVYMRHLWKNFKDILGNFNEQTECGK